MSAPLAPKVALASDVGITVNDGHCDLAAAGNGRGSATDPFLIGTAKTLAEMIDCSGSNGQNRQMTITGAVGDGTKVTYTTNGDHGAFGVGQVVTVSGMTPSSFNVVEARVLAATATTFQVASTNQSSFTSGGAVVSVHDFYKFTADIDLATGSVAWNDTRSSSISSVSGDGTTVSYVVADGSKFTAGDSVVIKGHSVNDFNLGQATVSSVSGNTVRVADTTNVAGGTGGSISHLGWANFPLYDADLDGQDHTVSGLTIDNPGNYQGLFNHVYRSNIENLKMTGVDIDTTGRDTSGDRMGALAGDAYGVGVANVSVSGTIIGTNEDVGMLFGYAKSANIRKVTTSGTLNFAAIIAASNVDGGKQPNKVGGILGYFECATLVNSSSSVNVNAKTIAKKNTTGESLEIYGTRVGGAVGYSIFYGSCGSIFRNSSASGTVTGGSYVGGFGGDLNYNGAWINLSATGNVFGYTNRDFATANYIGGLFGKSPGEGLFSGNTASGNVYVESFANGGPINRVGGFAGQQACCGEVRASSSTGSVTIVQNSTEATNTVKEIGGFFGAYECCGAVTSSFSTGNVTVTSASGDVANVGGFMGVNYCCGGSQSSYSTGNVTVTLGNPARVAAQIGGFVGQDFGNNSWIGSYSTGNVSVTNGYSIGGFVGLAGYNDSFVDTYSTGNVTAKFDGSTKAADGDDPGGVAAIGGFVGRLNAAAEVVRSFATGNVVATPVTTGQTVSGVGGLFGYVNLTDQHVLVQDSFYRGSLTGTTNVGGLIGLQGGSGAYRADRVYVAATISATGTGAVSDPVSSGAWTDASGVNFFDSTLAGTAVNVVGFNGASTADMKKAATFTAKGWNLTSDTSPWRISSSSNGGYPYLVPLLSETNPSGATTTTTTTTVPAATTTVPAASAPVVVNTTKRVGTTWTLVRRLKFSGNHAKLTTDMKSKLDLAAQKISASKCTSIDIRVYQARWRTWIGLGRAQTIRNYLGTKVRPRVDTKLARLSVLSRYPARVDNSADVFCGK